MLVTKKHQLLTSLFVSICILLNTSIAVAGQNFIDEKIEVSSNDFTIIDFTLPSAGIYELSAYTNGEEVGGVAQLFDNLAGQLYSIDFNSNSLPIPFEVIRGGDYSFVIRLGDGQVPADLNFVVESADATSSTSASSSSKVTYSAKKKIPTPTKTNTSAKEVPETKNGFEHRYGYTYFVDQKKVFDSVFGTGWKNVWGLWSKDSNSAIAGKVIFTGDIPKNAQVSINIEDIRGSEGRGEIFKIGKPNIVTKDGINVLTFTSNPAKIRGDSLYSTYVSIKSADRKSLLYRFHTTLSLDYKMSLGCSSSLIALSTIRDTSVGFLQSVSLTANAVNGVFSDLVKGTPLYKIPLVKRNAILNKLLDSAELQKAGDLSSFGLELIDFAGAVAKGDKVKVQVIIKGKVTDKIKKELHLEPQTKAGNFIATVTETKDQAIELTKFLATQGKNNGDTVIKTCAKHKA